MYNLYTRVSRTIYDSDSIRRGSETVVSITGITIVLKNKNKLNNFFKNLGGQGRKISGQYPRVTVGYPTKGSYKYAPVTEIYDIMEPNRLCIGRGGP